MKCTTFFLQLCSLPSVCLKMFDFSLNLFFFSTAEPSALDVDIFSYKDLQPIVPPTHTYNTLLLNLTGFLCNPDFSLPHKGVSITSAHLKLTL